MDIFQTIELAVKNELQKLFGDAVTIESKIIRFADEAVNYIKTNPELPALAGQLATIAEAIDPGLKPMISGIELEFPKLLGYVTAGTSELEKPVAEQFSNGITALEGLKGISATAYAGALATLNSLVQNYVFTNNSVVVSASDKLLASQALHKA